MQTRIGTSLVASCRRGDAAAVTAALAAGADPNAADEAGWTALTHACWAGREGIVERLVAAGARPDERGRDGVGPLFAAVLAGHPAVVELLLGLGAARTAAGGWSVLRCAAALGDEATCLALAKHGMEVEWLEAAELSLAVSRKTRRVHLVEAGRDDSAFAHEWGGDPISPDVFAIDGPELQLKDLPRAARPLAEATRWTPSPRAGRPSPTPLPAIGFDAHVRLVPAAAAPPDPHHSPTFVARDAPDAKLWTHRFAQSVHGEIADETALSALLCDAIRDRASAAVVTLLRDRRAQVTPRAVEEAARSNDHELLETVLGSSGHRPPELLVLALCHAARFGKLTMVERLLAAGADPNLRDPAGQSALLEAALRGSIRLIHTLHRAGADPEGPPRHGQSALMVAASSGRGDAIASLLAIGADLEARDDAGRTALHHAARRGQTTAVEILLAEGIRPNTVDEAGNTPLLIAASEINVPVSTLRALVAGGAALELTERRGRTPLLCAVARADSAVALLELGANASVRDADGDTAFHLAASGSDGEDLYRALVQAGGDIDALDERGETALMRIVRSHGFVGALIQSGADPNVRSERGETAQELALRLGKEHAAELIVWNLRLKAEREGH